MVEEFKMNGESTALTIDTIYGRLCLRGADGKFCQAHTGLETDAELKAIIHLIFKNGHHDLCDDACFFSRVIQLHPDSLKFAVNLFPRSRLLEILEEECACRNEQKQI